MNSVEPKQSASPPNASRFPGARERGHCCPPNRGASNPASQQGKAGERRSKATRVDAQVLGSAMFTDQAWEQMGRALHLSDRELQILRGVFDDRIESAIAADLGISPHTVHTHFDRLHRKLGVANRPQLILRAVNSFLTLRVSAATPGTPLPQQSITPRIH